MSHPCPRGRIEPDLDNLEALHRLYPWIPGRENIRPREDILRSKRETIWDGESLSRLLFPVSLLELWEGKCEKEYVFLENAFPYDVSRGTHHYVLWFSGKGEKPDDRIVEILEKEVASRGGTEFVYYVNPKMTVSDIWHVQVFWGRNTRC
jgi:hypothetical protein